MKARVKCLQLLALQALLLCSISREQSCPQPNEVQDSIKQRKENVSCNCKRHSYWMRLWISNCCTACTSLLLKCYSLSCLMCLYCSFMSLTEGCLKHCCYITTCSNLWTDKIGETSKAACCCPFYNMPPGCSSKNDCYHTYEEGHTYFSLIPHSKSSVQLVSKFSLLCMCINLQHLSTRKPYQRLVRNWMHLQEMFVSYWRLTHISTISPLQVGRYHIMYSTNGIATTLD